MTPITAKAIAAVTLAAAILAIAYSIHLRDKSKTSKLNLDDLLIGEDGRMSKGAAVMFGAFGLTTWVMVVLTLRDKLTEGYLAIYVGAWIAPVVTALIKKPPPAPSPPIPEVQNPSGLEKL